MKEVYIIGSNFYIEKGKSSVYSYENEKIVHSYNKNEFAHIKQFKFTKKWYSYMKQIPTLMEQYNILGKRIYGKMFYLTKECFEPSPTKLLINLIKNRCYAVIRFPELLVKVYPKDTEGNDLSQLTAPVKDMYVQIPFEILNVGDPQLSVKMHLYGFQAGIDEKRNYLQSHLEFQNGRFCLGSSELGTLISLLQSSDLIEDNNLDVFEIVLDYIDIMLRCQSNEGGPYRKIEKMYMDDEVDTKPYFHQILKSYFLHFPYKDWVIQPVKKYIDKEEYKGLYTGLIITNTDKLFKQIDEFIPSKFKISIDSSRLQLKDKNTYGRDYKDKSSDFRFNDSYVDTYTFSSTTGYWISEETRDLSFISDEFKEKFMDYLLARSLQYSNTI